MIIGLPKEIKAHEYRVALTPNNVENYTRNGHSVLVESNAGLGAGFSNEDYLSTGSEVISDKRKLFERAEMICKVKEPLPEEYELLHPHQILFTYLHLAANNELTQTLLAKHVTAIAYETVQLKDGSLPLLTPMSEIAGRLSIQEGAKYLEKPSGGRGILLGGIPGVQRGKVAILGGGVVGTNAAKMAIGLGAQVSILDICPRRLSYLDDLFGNQIQTLHSNKENINGVLQESDLVVGAVLIPGAKAPKLINKNDLKRMKKGSVLVDVAIDQGGCFETSYPTTHNDPTFIVDDILHYCVANMPGAVALTSTRALTDITLPYGLDIADKGWERAAQDNPALSRGLNTYRGELTCLAVANA